MLLRGGGAACFVACACLAFACSEREVSLGSWGRASGGSPSGGSDSAGSAGTENGGTSGTGGSDTAGTSGTEGSSGSSGADGSSGTGGLSGSGGTSGMGGTSPGGRPNLGCDDVGDPGERSPLGDEEGVTLTSTRWNWPGPVESMEWEMRAETQTKADGYLFAYEFGFAGEAVGFVGMQVNGLYQADPPSSTPIRSNMVVFWISHAPIAAEVGDFPVSRVYREVDTPPTVGTKSDNWLTVNAQYEWEACKTYRFRVGKTLDPSTEGIWYGAWMLDLETNEELQVGRILVPQAWGGLDDSSEAWSNRLGYSVVDSCEDEPEPVSVFFATPSADDGTVQPIARVNSFPEPECPTSRFTEFSNGVRQEIGLAP